MPISQHRIQRARARGGPARRSARRGPGSRSLLVATPVVAVSLGLLALAANNDLSSLQTTGGVVVGRAATTTTTTRPTTTLPRSATTRPGSAGGPVSTGDLGAGGATGGLDPGATGGVGADPGGTGVPVGGTTLPGEPTIPGGGPASTEAGGTSGGTSVSDPGAGTSGGTTPDGQPVTTRNPGTANPVGSSPPGANPATGRGGGATSTTRSDGASSSGSGLLGLAKSLFVLAVLVTFGVAGVYLLLSIIQALRGIRRRPGDADEDDFEELDDPLEPIVIDAASARWTLERIRAELESETDPRVAIRHAYSMVESGFGAGGGLARRRTETPLQYLERSLGTIGGNPQSLRTLTGLFLLARYSNRPINEAMRTAAIRAVIELQGSYRLAGEVAA